MTRTDRDIKPLSKEYAQKWSVKYAWCSKCKRLYFDDIPLAGNLYCPHCPTATLVRNVKVSPVIQEGQIGT